VFLHLLLSACYKKTKYKGRTIARGSVATTIPRLSELTCLSNREVRTALEHLKRTGEIEIEATNRESIIKVHNYDLYQDTESPERQANDRQTTDERHANDVRTEEEGKKGKKVRNKEKGTNVPKKKVELLPVPVEIAVQWDAFVDMRVKIKSPLTDNAHNLALKELEKLAPGDYPTQCRILERSVLNNWKGLFPLKGEDQNGTYQRNASQHAPGNTGSAKPKYGNVL
jgi:hypothetical protein